LARSHTAKLTISNFVNHESPVPAFMQVEQDLRRQILSGTIQSDVRLPRETELATLYGVSRMTVRRSLEGLETGGLIRRVHGVGTIATPPEVPVAVDLSSMISIAEQIRRQGHEPRTVIDVQTIATPTPLIRSALLLGDNDTATVVRRVRYSDARPILINTSWLPTKRFPGLDRAELLDGSLWKTLTTNFKVTPAATEEHFELVQASADEARLLHVEEGDTLIRVSGTTFDGDDHPVERCFSLWAGNVRFHFSSRKPRKTRVAAKPASPGKKPARKVAAASARAPRSSAGKSKR
jgi:GntR family transcriptional regulator